jgi:hypothetical protein
MKKSKASKGTKGRAAAKDLRVGKRSGDAVKGGRITNVRVAGSSGTDLTTASKPRPFSSCTTSG